MFGYSCDIFTVDIYCLWFYYVLIVSYICHLCIIVVTRVEQPYINVCQQNANDQKLLNWFRMLIFASP